MATLTVESLRGRSALPIQPASFPKDPLSGIQQALTSLELATYTLFLMPKKYYNEVMARRAVMDATVDALTLCQSLRGKAAPKRATFIATALLNSNIERAETEDSPEEEREQAFQSIVDIASKAHKLALKLETAAKESKEQISLEQFAKRHLHPRELINIAHDILTATMPLSAMIAVHREERRVAVMESDQEDAREEVIQIAAEAVDQATAVLDADTAIMYQAEKEDHFETGSLQDVASTMSSIGQSICRDLASGEIIGKKGKVAAAVAISATKESLSKIREVLIQEGSPVVAKAPKLALTFLNKMTNLSTSVSIDNPVAAYILTARANRLELRARQVELLWKNTPNSIAQWYQLSKETEDYQTRLKHLDAFPKDIEVANQNEERVAGDRKKVIQAIMDAELAFRRRKEIDEEIKKIK